MSPIGERRPMIQWPRLEKGQIMTADRDATIYMLARALFDLGAITFGDFTLGRTAVHSPVYVNPRRLLSEPVLLQQVAQLLDEEIKTAQGRRRPRLSPFGLVAGVPFGGLHLALAYS